MLVQEPKVTPSEATGKYLRLVTAVAGKLGDALTPAEQVYVKTRAQSAEYGDNEDDAAMLVGELEAQRVAGGLPAPASALVLEIDSVGDDDPRWELLRELEDARVRAVVRDDEFGDVSAELRGAVLDSAVARRTGIGRWAAIRVRTSEPIGFYNGSSPPPIGRTVDVSFDSRMPFVRLVRELRQQWRSLVSSGIVRRTRPLGPRKVALLRFVCLEMPGASWADRHDAWNVRHLKWAIPERTAFIKEFHDAEESLCGRAHALAWFYNAKARLTTQDLKALARQGDRDAERECRRRRDEGFRSINGAGIEVVLEKPKATARKRGLKP